MLDISQDIHSLSDFKRKTSNFIQRMKRSGHPLILTINGKAELVVQNAAAYQDLLDLVDRLETMEAINRGLADVEAGRTSSARTVLRRMRRKHGIPR